MSYDRDDALRLAQAAYRKRQYDAKRRELEPLSVDGLLERIATVAGEKRVKVNFRGHPDLDYLRRKVGFGHRFIGRMLAWFGEPVVLEALRLAVLDEIAKERVFVGICRRLEREADGVVEP